MGELRDHDTTPAVAIKQYTYRGRIGWLVYESRRHKCSEPLCFGRRAFPQRVFVTTRYEAERMKRQWQLGLPVMFDWQIAEQIRKGNRQLLLDLGYELDTLEGGEGDCA